MGLLNIGASALNAAYAQLQTTGNNIANVNTVGYHRQTVSQSPMAASTATTYTGMGVQVDAIRRQYDQYLEQQVASTQSVSSADKARSSQLNSLEGLFSDSDTSIGAAVDSLRTSVADLVNTPGDPSARTVVISRADAVASQIRSLDGQLSALGRDTDLRIGDAVQSLNQLLGQMAELNGRITASNGSAQQPNDLLDQRDALIGKINEIARGNAYLNADGSATLFTSSGEPLVIGTQASTLSVTTDPLGSGQPQVMLKTMNADLPVDATRIGGGSLSGLMRFRSEDLVSAQSRLGQMAAAFADAMNQVQASGVTATGAAGQPMYSVADPLVTGLATNGGAASFSVSVSDAAQLVASDYRIDDDGSNFVVTRLSDNVRTTLSGTGQVIDGLRFDVTGTAGSAGDRFLVQSSTQFARSMTMNLTDGSQLAVGVAVYPTLGTTNTGSLSVSGTRVTDPAEPNLSSAITLSFDGTGNYTATGTGAPAGAQPYVPGQAININGWSLTLAGTPAAGDTVTMGSTTTPGSDNRNAKLLYEAIDGRAVGGASMNDAYADLVADVGTRAQSAKTAATSSAFSLSNAQAARDSVSGVDLDEEATRLLQYQQAYQAAAKLISTSQTLFNSLLSAVNN